MPKLLMIVNEDRFFLSHRKEIAVAAKENGYDVTIVAKDTGRRNDVEALGLKMIDLPINPTGKNLAQDLKTLLFLLNLYRKERPNIVHHVGLKNILWGGLAAKLCGVHGVVNAVSGLGVIFSQEKSSVMAGMILKVLRFSHHRKNLAVIFQNSEDRTLFKRKKIVNERQIFFTKGSGCDLNEFDYTPDPDGEKINVIFTARMVREKGVVTLVEAAEMLRNEYQEKVEFWLCGGLSNNPRALSEADLNSLCDGKYIKWLGHRTDVKDLLKKSNIVAFPSYYREGVPKSLIEASAIGRPIVTTNSIGCKDVVEDGVNGYLITIKDSAMLAARLKELFDSKELRVAMGKKSREFAERDFSVENVVKTHLDIYKKIG